MCQIDCCDKTSIAVSLHDGVLICAEHVPIRPRFRLLTGKKKYKRIYKNWLKTQVLSYPESYENEKGRIQYV